MITTTYKCDRCGHEQNKPDQMWDIMLCFRHHENSEMRLNIYSGDRKAIWCRECVKLFPTIASFAPNPAEGKSAPTLEETIREIIREEVDAATGRGA